MIMSGFVSKVINEIVDIPGNPIKNAIKKADKDRKAKNQNIETRIYQVIIDAIKEFTKGTYKSEDILYDATEMIINGFISKKENIEAVKTGLKMLELQITDNKCEDFLGTLCDEICKDENDILYKEIVLMQHQQTLREIHKGFEENTRNQGTALEILEDVRGDTKFIRERFDNNVEHCSELQIRNRADEYAEKWYKNVFLNNFSERDENAGINVKLKDIYLEEQLPHYIWKKNKKISYDLRKLLTEHVVEKSGKKMLLVLGQPGIGKSTLITWMMANFEEKKDNFLVYQFASDLKCVNWQGDNILSQIFEMLNLKYNELENKVLILDGFDEIHASSDREGILNKLNHELARIRNFTNFSLIITCRENYVYKVQRLECDFITLQVWDDNQIRCFCEAYGKESGKDISTSKMDKLLDNKEVFGIPLILYMVLALGIAIEKSESLVEVYDQIFSIDRSSIYDRCIKNSRYDGEHRISEDKIKQAIHQISQTIAFWIFENNSEKALIPQKEYKTICDSVINQISYVDKGVKRDFLIGNYFKIVKHCEGIGTQELHFIHRSIYEYFVVVYFFESLQNQTTKEEVAGKLGELLKKGELSLQILEFIKCKFDNIKQYSLSDFTKESFQMMLQDGMTYYMKGKYKNIIEREMNIFANMLRVVHVWNPQLGKLDDNIALYLQYNTTITLDLRGADLRGANLRGANLSLVDLSEADLRGANLSQADFMAANLSEADLRGADLRGADLSIAYLKETIFDEKQVELLHEKCNFWQSKVFIPKTDEIIIYRDYCARKQNS